MKTFIIAVLLISLFTSSYAMEQSTMDLYANMGLMYAQNAFGIDGECITVIQTAYEQGTKAYKAITESNMTELISIITGAQKIYNDFMTHCMSKQ